jgi:hypothetical protein
MSRENIHARPAGQRLPAGPFEEPLKSRVADQTGGVALVGVDGQLDLDIVHEVLFLAGSGMKSNYARGFAYRYL